MAKAALRAFRRSTAVLVAAVLALSASGLAAQGADRLERLEPLPGSRVTLRGRTSVGPWRCVVGGAWAVVDVAAADPLSDLVVRLPVSGVRCGSRGMEQDLRSALRSDRYPDIVVRGVRAISSSGRLLRVEATLEVAGVARGVSTVVSVDADNPAHVRIGGSIPLRMTDFGVEPPTAMLGLVRAHDEVVVEYDVRVATATLAVVATRAPLAQSAP